MNFEAMKQALIDAAARYGVEKYEIYAQVGESISAETLKDGISSFSSGVSGGISFRCIVDGKMGYASSEDATAEAMDETVRRAVSNAKCIDSTDEAEIYAGSPSYETVDNGDTALTDAVTVRDLALRLQRAIYAQGESVSDGTQSEVFSIAETTYLYNSYGLSLSNRVGVSGAYANAVVRQGDEAQEHYEMASGRAYADFEALPETAFRRATEKLGATTPTSGEYDVLFSGKQFRMFLSAFSSAFSAKQAQLGLSLLAGKEGEQIAAAGVSIVDDPMREGTSMKMPFDGEGVATSRKRVVENGVLKTLLYDLTTAKKAGVSSTGNGQRGGYTSPVSISPYSFSIEAGEDSEETLFAAVQDGIYITECKGFHAGANDVTGDFSIESAGFMIRDGKRAEPVKSFTVAGNFFELLRQIDRIGDTVRWGIAGGSTTFGSPDILVRQMKVAGK